MPEGRPGRGLEVEFELTTPTGAAIVTTAGRSSSDPMPAMTVRGDRLRRRQPQPGTRAQPAADHDRRERDGASPRRVTGLRTAIGSLSSKPASTT
ncbi:MAG: LarC family nickel insertion protein [Desulfobacterales bacterium]|nr:LarC family nickel insertion protein [Desulfobacterales bacterium]